MQVGIITVVVLYEIITIGVVGWFITKKSKNKEGEDEFALGGRSLGTCTL